MAKQMLQYLRRNCIVTRPGLLTQDFTTRDGAITVHGRRIRGGYTVGTSLYSIHNNGTLVNDSTTPGFAYAYVYQYLKGQPAGKTTRPKP